MNKKIVGVLGLASVAVIGGTFAYFTQVATVDNPFDTAKYQTVVTEDFIPEDGEKWQPGAEVNKDLYVQNTGDRDVVVRVKLEDYWYRGEGLITNAQAAADTTGETKANTFIELFGGYVITPPVATEDGISTFQLNTTDGETQRIGEDGKPVIDEETGEPVKDGTVVFKTFENEDKWAFNPKDGYFYYKTTLAPGTSTEKFLDKVQLDPQLDLGHFMTKIYSKVDTKGTNLDEVSKDVIDGIVDIDTYMIEKGWTYIEDKDGKDISVIPTSIKTFNEKAGTEYTKESLAANNQGIFTTAVTRPDNDKLGYSDANYILRITVETVQATDEAVISTFFGNSEGMEDALKEIGDELNWNLSIEKIEN